MKNVTMNMLRIFGCLLCSMVLFLPCDMLGQGWEKIYDFENYGSLEKRCFRAPDGGFVISDLKRSSLVFSDPDTNRIIKTDHDGNIEYILKTVDMNHLQQLRSVTLTSDSGYCYHWIDDKPSTGLGAAAFTVKFDKNYNLIWEEYIESAVPWALIELSNGDLFGVGKVSIQGAQIANQYEKIYFSKRQSDGTLTFANPIAKYFDKESPGKLLETMDGNLAMIGSASDTGQSPISYGFLMKLDVNGSVLWNRGYSSLSTTRFVNFTQTADKGFLITGYTNTGLPNYETDLTVIKTDSAGNLIWEQTYVSPDIQYGSDIDVTPAGDFMVVGRTQEFTPTPNGSALHWDEDSIFLCAWVIDDVGSVKNRFVYSFGFQSSGETLFVHDSSMTIFGGDAGLDSVGSVGTSHPYLVRTNLNGLQCQSGCVWPGDADNDGVANVLDVLAIGLSYNNNGLLRFNPDNTWRAQPSFNWQSQLYNGEDEKFADCNGDALIDLFDLLPIALNYGQTHNKQEARDTSGGPELFVVFPNDTVSAGDTIVGTLLLGSDSIPVDTFYGISFTLNYDNTIVDTSSMEIEFTDSWAGNSTNTISLSQDFYYQGAIDAGYCRTDHQSVNGYGAIGTVSFIMIDDLAGKRQGVNEHQFYFSNITMLGDLGENLRISSGQTTLYTGEPLSGLIDEDISKIQLHVFPLPADKLMNLVFTFPVEDVMVFNLLGELVERIGKVEYEKQLDVSGYPEGTYLVVAPSAGKMIREKIVVIH